MEVLQKNNSSLDQLIFWGVIFTSVFLLLVYLNYAVFHLDFVLIGVFQELLTIPCCLSQPVLLFLAGWRFFQNRFQIKSYAFVALVIGGIAFILVWGSFFFW